MTDYYISNAGDASNPGTIYQPWNLAKIFDFVATTGLADGDRLFFKAGETFVFTSTLQLEPANSAGTNYYIGSYGEGRATLDGVAAGDTNIITLYNRGATIEGLNFVGVVAEPPEAAPSASLLQFYSDIPGTYDANIRDCKITGGRRAINIGGFGSDAITFVGTVERVKCLAHRETGINSYSNSVNNKSSQLTVRNCYVEPVSGNGIILSGCSNSIIEGCHASGHRTLESESDADNLIWFYRANDCIIRDCIAENGKGLDSSTDGGGFGIDVESERCTIERCLALNCDGQGILVFEGPGHIIRDNIVINCGLDDASAPEAVVLFFANGALVATDFQFTNNTIYASADVVADRPMLRVDKANFTGIIANNIFVSEIGREMLSFADDSTSEIQVYGNLYHAETGNASFRRNATTYSDLTSFRAGSHEILNSSNTGLTGSAGFVNQGGLKASDYRLATGSQAIGAGIDITSLTPALTPGSDYEQNTFPASPDLGAYQPRTNDKVELFQTGKYNDIGFNAVIYGVGSDDAEARVYLTESSERGLFRGVAKGLADGDCVVQIFKNEFILETLKLSIKDGAIAQSGGLTESQLADAVAPLATQASVDNIPTAPLLAANYTAPPALVDITSAVNGARDAVITQGNSTWVTATGFNTVEPENPDLSTLETQVATLFGLVETGDRFSILALSNAPAGGGGSGGLTAEQNTLLTQAAADSAIARKAQTNVVDVDEAAVITTMDDDGTTPLFVSRTLDRDGNPSTVNTVRREPVV